MKGKQCRAPGFLVTSSDPAVASGFASADPEHPCASWRFEFDRRGETDAEYRVRHMAFVSKALIPTEEEYLFAPYSVFTLVSVKWSATRGPHKFILQPAIDNITEDESMPLAPWY